MEVTDRDIARLTGYTRPVLAECALHTLELLIRPETDLDSTFRAFDSDAGNFLSINGWLWTFEDAVTDLDKVEARVHDDMMSCETVNFVRAAHPGLEC